MSKMHSQLKLVWYYWQFRVLREAQQLGITDAKIYSDCMSVVTRVKEIDSSINQAIKASIPSYDIWKEIHDIILVLTMEWDIMWVKAHPEREWGNCSPTQREEKFNQLPVTSRLIFLADHLASHRKECNDLLFDEFEVKQISYHQSYQIEKYP